MNQSPRQSLLFQRLLISGAIAATSALSVFSPLGSGSVKAALYESPKTVVDEAWQIVNREYVDPGFNQVNWSILRRQLLNKDYTSREQAYNAIQEALKRLGDPYTRFMEPKQFQALTNQTAGELSGIGIRLELNEQSKSLAILEPIENSPAFRAGILPGDMLVAIDGKSTTGMTLEQASGMIRGTVGTPISLKLSREGQGMFDLKLTRAQIQLPAVRYSLKQEGGMRVGYIRLTEFSSHSASQMRQAIEALNQQKVDAFVLDVRGNPGGLLHASIDISRMWLEKGSIVRTVDRKGDNEQFKANHTAMSKLPLAILVDSNSASASEILAGAIKDNRRGTVVGSQTFGKALVQAVHSLSDGSGLAVTVAHYYTPNGTDISHKGITPDVRLDLDEVQQKQLASNPRLLGTTSDPQYMGAISVLEQTILAQPRLTEPNASASSR